MAFFVLVEDKVVIMLLSIVLLSFPVVAVVVLKNIIPDVAAIVAPVIVQFLMVLLEASFINRKVDVPDPEKTVVLDIVNELPSVFNPSMVTLSAPSKFNIGFENTAPEIVLAPTGFKLIEVQLVDAFKEVAPVSVVLSAMAIMVTAPVPALAAFKAVKTPPAIVKEE